VGRVGSNGCRGGHAARPLPGPYRSRAAPSTLVSANRSEIESADFTVELPTDVHTARGRRRRLLLLNLSKYA
jgi:hypothetical protein